MSGNIEQRLRELDSIADQRDAAMGYFELIAERKDHLRLPFEPVIKYLQAFNSTCLKGLGKEQEADSALIPESVLKDDAWRSRSKELFEAAHDHSRIALVATLNWTWDTGTEEKI